MASPPTLIKVNSKNNIPRLSACEGISRDHHGTFLGSSTFIGHESSFYAEFMVVILAIGQAWLRGWHKLRIECDAMSMTQCLQNFGYSLPWKLHTSWFNCLYLLRLI